MKRKLRILSCMLLAAAVSVMTPSCTQEVNLDDIREDIAQLKDRVATLEDAVAALRDALDKGKSITSVTPFYNGAESGWCIFFSDGTSIDILNGRDGAQGEKGEPGEKGEDGKDGKDGKDGENGKDGEDGKDGAGSDLLKSVVEDEEAGVIVLTLVDGTEFRFNLDFTYPTGIVVLTREVALSEKGQAKFDFRINPSNARFVPVVEGKECNIELDMVSSRANADSYVTVPENYKLASVKPAVDGSGKVLAGQYTATVEELGVAVDYSEYAVLVLTTLDGRGERVQLSSDLIRFEWKKMAGIKSLTVGGVAATKASDDVFMVKLPYTADLKSLNVSAAADEGKVTVNGSADLSRIDLSTPVKLLFTSNDGASKEYTLSVHYTNLPVVYVTTPSPITSKDYWTEGCSMQICNAGDLNDTYTEVQIKGRGNSTWGLAKKPYAIKLDSKAEVMGMPKHKRWVLLANYMDNTALRNDVSFKIAQSMTGMAWNPHGCHVDLVMNGEFLGNYYLCEQIKVDKNRVNITEIKPGDVDEVSKTGGFIFEMDTYFDEMVKFKTKYFKNQYCSYYPSDSRDGLPVQFKDPDEDIADDQKSYIVDYFNTVEEILIDGNPRKLDVFDYIDMDSFIDWWLVHELSGNMEPWHPKSCYMNKDRGGKLCAGPVWDFDYDTYVITGSEIRDRSGLLLKDCLWYHWLFLDSRFVTRVKERWAMHKPVVQKIADEYISAKSSEISESVSINKQRWPGSHSWSSSDVKSALQYRINQIDSAINALR